MWFWVENHSLLRILLDDTRDSRLSISDDTLLFLLYLRCFLMAARGRPLLIVSRSELEHLLSLRFTWSEIAAILNVSVKTLQRRAKEWNLMRYTNITLATLEESVRAILHNFPSCGEVMINGHLKSKGIHVRRSLLRGYSASSRTKCNYFTHLQTFIQCT